MKLSDVAIRQAKPLDKPYKLPDGTGLYLLVNKSASTGAMTTVLRASVKPLRMVFIPW